VRADRARAARRGAAHGTVHVAAPRGLPRALPCLRALPAERDLDERLARIEALAGGEERTFFEVATALGFDWFASQGVDWGVVEVGWVAGSTPRTCWSRACARSPRWARSRRDSRRLARADRRREGGDPQAGRARGERRRARRGGHGDRACRARRGAPLHQARDLVEVRTATYARGACGWRSSASPGARSSCRRRCAAGTSARTRAWRWRCWRCWPAGRARGRCTRCARASPRCAGRGGWSPHRPCGACGGTGRTTWTALRRMAHAWRDEMGMAPPAAIVFAVGRDKDAARHAAAAGAFAPEARPGADAHAQRARAAPDALASRPRGLGLAHATAPSVREALVPWLDHGPTAAVGRPGACSCAGRCSRSARRWRRSAARRARCCEADARGARRLAAVALLLAAVTPRYLAGCAPGSRAARSTSAPTT